MIVGNSFFEQSTKILITKRIIQFRGEVYQFSNVTGFSFQRLQPEVIPLRKESVIPWLIICSVSVWYIFSAPSPLYSGRLYTLIAYAALIFSILRIIQIELAPSSFMKERYGLILTLNSGDSRIFPSYEKEEVLKVVDEIYAFMRAEDERSSVSIEYKYDYSTHIGTLSVDQSKIYQHGSGDNIGGDKVMRNKRVIQG